MSAAFPETGRRVPWAVCMAVLALSPAAGADASADPVRAEESPLATESLELCVAEHERGRLHKAELRLFEARRSLTRCAAPDCPVAIRADCDAWLVEVEALVPSVLIVVEGATAPLEGLRVQMDGVELTHDLHEALPVAIGRHNFRFELPPYAPVEQEIELAPGEKNRILRVRFEPPAPLPEPAPSPARPPLRLDVPPSPPTLARPIPPISYALGAGALAFAATAGTLAATALVDHHRAEDQCAPRCSRHVSDSIRQRLLFADVAGGVAAVLGALTLYTYLERPTISVAPVERSAPTPSVGITLTPGATNLSIRGRF